MSPIVSTPKKFIIADMGHIQHPKHGHRRFDSQYAIILIDARKGVIEQTKRHTFIANLLRIRHVVVAVNKMDLVDYNQEVYDSIVEEYTAFASRLGNIVDIRPIPISALNGDNIVERSKDMSWYDGSNLLYHL